MRAKLRRTKRQPRIGDPSESDKVLTLREMKINVRCQMDCLNYITVDLDLTEKNEIIIIIIIIIIIRPDRPKCNSLLLYATDR
jgi:hypothetical protein